MKYWQLLMAPITTSTPTKLNGISSEYRSNNFRVRLEISVDLLPSALRGWSSPAFKNLLYYASRISGWLAIVGSVTHKICRNPESFQTQNPEPIISPCRL